MERMACASHPLPSEAHPAAVAIKSIVRIRRKDGLLYIDYKRPPPLKKMAHPLAVILKGIVYVRRKDGKLCIGYKAPAPSEMRASLEEAVQSDG